MYRDSCHVIARPFTQLRIVTDAKMSGNRRSRHAISTRHLRIVAPRKQKESKPTVSRFFPPCFGQKLTCRERCLPVNCRSHEPVLLRSRPIFATRLRSLHAGKKKRKNVLTRSLAARANSLLLGRPRDHQEGFRPGKKKRITFHGTCNNGGLNSKTFAHLQIFLCQ